MDLEKNRRKRDFGKTDEPPPRKGSVEGRKADPKAAATLKRLMSRYPDVQLATLVDEPPEGEGWIHEIKFDGYRLLGFVAGGIVRLRTRNGHDWTQSFPSIFSTLLHLKIRSAVIDMEAVLLDPEGKSSFQALQAALGEGGNTERIAAYGFDLLYLDENDLTRLPLTEHKAKLKALLTKSDQAILRHSRDFAKTKMLPACNRRNPCQQFQPHPSMRRPKQ